MTVEAFFLCFNESKMIEHTLNYYTRFCDKITIIDNQSTDNSVAIVKDKFPGVIIEDLDTGGEYREDMQIDIRNNRWKDSEADYVIMADMDEFIVDTDLVGKLKEMKRQNVAIPKVVGYNMYSETFPDDYNTLIIDQVTKKFRDRDFNKNIIFSPSLVKEMNFGPGSHFCNPEYKEGINPQTNHSFELTLLHFKYLGRAYLYEKHRGYGKRMSDTNRRFKFGSIYELGTEFVDNAFDKIEKHLHKHQSPSA
ncbi:MAG: glycosyltransferase family 2 protein [Haliscomenobacter sp.]|nr:glycosyltransferase family 2 protein [Haliscomenobacter sp.]